MKSGPRLKADHIHKSFHTHDPKMAWYLAAIWSIAKHLLGI